MANERRVYVLLCDRQSDHGYVDTQVVGVYLTEAALHQAEAAADQAELAKGERVTGLEDEWATEDEGDWTVCHRPEEALLYGE
jgi:hypothetical protein